MLRAEREVVDKPGAERVDTVRFEEYSFANMPFERDDLARLVAKRGVLLSYGRPGGVRNLQPDLEPIWGEDAQPRMIEVIDTPPKGQCRVAMALATNMSERVLPRNSVAPNRGAVFPVRLAALIVAVLGMAAWALAQSEGSTGPTSVAASGLAR